MDGGDEAEVETGDEIMNRNYQTPAVSAEWAQSRETDMAVAVAIHAIANSRRSPEAIWDAPTKSEWENVEMAV
ncbi:hypothetical protein [Pannonibacter indicus]|uniref:hypothetical protein n=1 Tax=Pannonibacter indicus TaxID=466044 RepID=UPI003918F467